MNDAACAQFLRWAAPRMRLRWRAFRRVRRQVRKRLNLRLQELELADADAYRRRLEADPDEWARLDALCRVTISRFYRDRRIFDLVRDVLLPELAVRASARGEDALRCWSVGCASGEEPYTLALIWRLAVGPRFPGLRLDILATDADPALLGRCRDGRYPASSLRDLPAGWRGAAFAAQEEAYVLRDAFRGGIQFCEEDIRAALPAGRFHLILCRNLVFTYFDERVQEEVLGGIAARLLPGGALVVGGRETLPERRAGLRPGAARAIWRREA